MKFKILLAASVALLLVACAPEGGSDGVTREAVNPWEWGAVFGFNQGEVVSGTSRTLYLAGQTSIDENGAAIHGDDPRAQFETAFANLDTVLAAADMDRSNVVRLTVFTTNVGAIIDNWDVYMARYAEAGNTPPVTLIGVASLFEPELIVEIEAVAVD